jgi:inhibitor of KinA sporulation pathway (predicted exonuclease)
MELVRFVCISDIEATCELTSPGESLPVHEILEFPFLLCDLERDFEVVEQGRFFVKPVNTQVSTFCTNLTGITSLFIEENGQTLQQVVDLIESAIGAERATRTALCFDGVWDLSVVQREFRDKNIKTKFPCLWSSFIDLKVEFRRAFPIAGSSKKRVVVLFFFFFRLQKNFRNRIFIRCLL